MMTMYQTIPTVLKEGTELPAYAHEGDAGLDLCATEDVTLMPGEWKMVGSGIATAIPVGYCGKVYPRSGLGCKGLVLKNQTGVIDANYRGEIKVPLYNNNALGVWKRIKRFMCYRLLDMVDEPEGTIHVHKGDRVAQLCIELVPDTELVEVEELDETDRGQGGFGSSGTSSITGGDRL